MSPQTIATGKRGEEIAADLLRQKGFRILEKHFTTRWGEIDIIAQEKDTLVFVEVKTRKGTGYGYPEEAVTSSKLRSLKRAAQFYWQAHPHLPDSLRIDVVAIILDNKNNPVDLKHYRGVGE